MTSLFFFFLLLASLLQVVLYAMMSHYCPIPLTPPLPPMLAYHYNHFQLVKTWISAFCHLNQWNGSLTLIPNFTTHGMWPADSRGVKYKIFLSCFRMKLCLAFLKKLGHRFELILRGRISGNTNGKNMGFVRLRSWTA